MIFYPFLTAESLQNPYCDRVSSFRVQIGEGCSISFDIEQVGCASGDFIDQRLGRAIENLRFQPRYKNFPRGHDFKGDVPRGRRHWGGSKDKGGLRFNPQTFLSLSLENMTENASNMIGIIFDTPMFSDKISALVNWYWVNLKNCRNGSCQRWDLEWGNQYS